MKLKDKVVVVIGATGGIGAPLCHRFHQAGARLVLVSRTEEKLARLREELGSGAIYTFDASNPQEVEEMFYHLRNVMGIKPDAVIITAGTHDSLSIDDTPAKALEMAQRHFHGIFLPSFVVGFMAQRFFRSNGGGLIVNISSHAAVRTDLPGNLSYAPMKAAAWSFMASLMNEIKDPTVRIVDLKPATVNTPGNSEWLDTPEKRATAVQPEAIADWIIEHFNDSNADLPTTVTFDAPVN